jgi:hypothetical protein
MLLDIFAAYLVIMFSDRLSVDRDHLGGSSDYTALGHCIIASEPVQLRCASDFPLCSQQSPLHGLSSGLCCEYLQSYKFSDIIVSRPDRE